jgi:hypothetical protein
MESPCCVSWNKWLEKFDSDASSRCAYGVSPRSLPPMPSGLPPPPPCAVSICLFDALFGEDSVSTKCISDGLVCCSDDRVVSELGNELAVMLSQFLERTIRGHVASEGVADAFKSLIMDSVADAVSRTTSELPNALLQIVDDLQDKVDDRLESIQPRVQNVATNHVQFRDDQLKKYRHTSVAFAQ